jgi:hypothetical protein
MLEGTDHHTTSQYSSHQHSQQSNNPVFQNSTLQPSNPCSNPGASTEQSNIDTLRLAHHSNLPTLQHSRTPQRHSNPTRTPTHTSIFAYAMPTHSRTLSTPKKPHHNTTTHHRHNETQLNTPHNKTPTHRTPHHTGTQHTT